MSLTRIGTNSLNAAAYSLSTVRSDLSPMLTSNLSFREEPFRLTPDQRFPYQSFTFQDAYQQLLNAVREGRGPVFLTGDAGTGKSLLLRVLKRELEVIGATVCFPSLVRASPLELLRTCLQDTQGSPPSADPEALLAALKALLEDRCSGERTTALLVDDTQDLDEERVGTLAALWSLQERGRRLLPMVLAGHAGVTERFRPYLTDHSSLALEVLLGPLEAWEIRPFVLHRLRAAGHQGDDPFSAAAYGLIQERSKGVPRRINLLCGTALMLASLEDRTTVRADDVTQALRDNWLDDAEATGLGSAQANELPEHKPQAPAGAAIIPADSWVERIQRAPEIATPRPDDQRAVPLTDQVDRSRTNDHELDQETLTEVNEVSPEGLAWAYDQTRVAVVRDDEGDVLALGPTFRVDASDAFHDIRRARRHRGKWRALRRPLLATAGLAGGVLLGGLVATHYPELTEQLKAQYRGARMSLGLDHPIAKTPAPPPTPARNDDSARAQSEASVATAYSNLAIVYQTRGDLEQAEHMHKKALEIHTALQDRESIARDYNNLGYIYWSRGDLAQAEAVYRKSLDLHEALGKRSGMADNYANLGSVYWTRRDLAKAEAMYRQALTLNRVLDRKEKLANNYGNLGVVYQTRGDLQQAQAMHQKAIAIYEGTGRHTEGLANAYGNLGSVYKRAGALDKAEDMYVRALRLYQQAGNHAQAKRAEALITALREANASKGGR